MSRARALARFIAAGRWRELVDVGRAELAFASAQLIVWTRPTGRLIETQNRASTPMVASTAAVGEYDDAHRLAHRLAMSVARAATHGILRPQCLVRAVALQRMLERHGLTGSSIRIGVRWTGGQFIAHAWVERHGEILGDTPGNTASFVPLTDAHVSPVKWV